GINLFTNNLKSFLQDGIVTDLLKAEEAYNFIKEIEKNSREINNSSIDVMVDLIYF
ncbi:MAG: hypothetical protein ACJARG_002049, partial [Arcticibacterium sp.]